MILDATGREAGGNGVSLSERQQAKLRKQNCTIGEANEIAIEHAIRATNNLGNQIPALVHTIVHAAIAGYHESLIERGIIPREHSEDTTMSSEPMKVYPTVEEVEVIAERVARRVVLETPEKSTPAPVLTENGDDDGIDSDEVEGLPALSGGLFAAHLQTITDVDELKALKKSDERKGGKAAIAARIKELEAEG